MIIASKPRAFSELLTYKTVRAGSKQNKKQWQIPIARQKTSKLQSQNKSQVTIARQKTSELQLRNERQITIASQKASELQSQNKKQITITEQMTSKVQSLLKTIQLRERESRNESIKIIIIANNQGNNRLESNQIKRVKVSISIKGTRIWTRND